MLQMTMILHQIQRQILQNIQPQTHQHIHQIKPSINLTNIPTTNPGQQLNLQIIQFFEQVLQ